MPSIKQLAREGHGAIEVEEASDAPLMIFLGGPIRYWWSLPKEKWNKGRHHKYLQYRAALETALIKQGYLVYRPYAALRGAWHPNAQWINNNAVQSCDAVIAITPKGVPAQGTEAEARLAQRCRIPTYRIWKLNKASLERVLREMEYLSEQRKSR